MNWLDIANKFLTMAGVGFLIGIEAFFVNSKQIDAGVLVVTVSGALAALGVHTTTGAVVQRTVTAFRDVAKPLFLIASMTLLGLGLGGCTEWQAVASSINATALQLDDQTRMDEAVVLTEAWCRLPYHTLQNLASKNPNASIALAAICGGIASGFVQVVLPGVPVMSEVPVPKVQLRLAPAKP